MATCYQTHNRRDALKGHPNLNGVDYIEVEDLPESELSESERREFRKLPPGQRGALLWQRRLKVYFFNNLSGKFAPSSITIEGGERIRGLRAVEAAAENNVLLVTVDRAGDFSSYTLSITPGEGEPPLDRLFSALQFSFKVNCPTGFDCRQQPSGLPQEGPAARLDYLARDYASFRRLMLDRMSVAMPDWKERHAADLGVTLVELLAYVGDRLSYRQDAVATEAYLGTARKRISVRRHARLIDYRMHDGCNSRVLVQIRAKETGDGCRLPGPDADGFCGTMLATTTSEEKTVLTPEELEQAPSPDPAEVFETMHHLTLYSAHNGMNFYTWGEDEAFLHQGATHAFLEDPPQNRIRLVPGDLLILEQKGKGGNAPKRHAVRLTEVSPRAQEEKDGSRTPGGAESDPLFPDNCLVRIEWGEEDALPFPLCLVRKGEGSGSQEPERMAVALGNIVLSDQGRTLVNPIAVEDGTSPASVRDAAAGGPIVAGKVFRPSLPGPVTQQGRLPVGSASMAAVFDPAASAASAFAWEVRDARPAIKLVEQELPGTLWLPRPDLLRSSRFARDFVVEMEEDGEAFLRFGDGNMGLKPQPPTTFEAWYRLGNGAAGNVGSGTVTHLIADPALHLGEVVETVWNPLPASGGVDPESIAQARQYASQAFRSQQRAVTAEDYAAMAERHPQVQRAAATVRWTGSWYTVFVTVDRLGSSGPADALFLAEIKRYLEWYRMAGYDIEVSAPQYVAVDLAIEVKARPGYFCEDVRQALLEVFSNRDLSGGRRGFFHPDNLTFGEPLYLSRLYAAAMAVEGAASVAVTKLERWGKPANDELDLGRLPVGRLEIVRLDNDPNFPERGRLEVQVKSS